MTGVTGAAGAAGTARHAPVGGSEGAREAVGEDDRPGQPLAISVVVPTYRRPDRLSRLLDALAAQTLAAERFEVIVVDDCSGDATAAVLSHRARTGLVRVRALTTASNGGPAMARNAGWRAALAPLVAFVDDDCVPVPGWLAAGLAAFDDPGVGVVQGRTAVPEGVDVTDLPTWCIWRDIDRAGPFFEACNIFYRREALAAAGGFDEAIGWWGEDTTAGWAVVEAGWAGGFAAGAVAVHDVERRGAWWMIRNGLHERNVVLLAARHPGYRRDAFWRPWASRRRDAAFVLAALGALTATRWRWAALVALPYLWSARPPLQQPGFVRTGLETVAVDAARTAGHLYGALRHRILVI